jgi:hypothetical protein
LLERHEPPQLWKPELHAIPQNKPSHVEKPLAGTAHAVQLNNPQEAVAKFETQAPLQSWSPLLHTDPQLKPSQVAVASGLLGHGAQRAPHELIEAFDSHTSRH